MGVKSFNSADLNNIAKKDGRYNVIENISGAKRTLNPPAAAYSVRKLTGLTGVPYDGPAMRILVDATGDGADATDLEFDINFTADGDLDVADIELKCTGGKDAYVVKWYDQSGAGKDAFQTAYAVMPKIATAGVVMTENGKPYIDGQNNCIFTSPISLSQPFTMFSVARLTAAPQRILHDGGFNFQHAGVTRLSAGVSLDGSTLIDNTKQHIFSALANGTNSKVFYDGTEEASGNAGTTGLQNPTVFTRTSATTSGTPYGFEFIIYGSDQTSNRTTIENNINSYFNIYQSRENILPGAAAAYSLRQLSDSSRLAVRVRRDTGVGSGTDDDEADVGFDANGEVSLDSPVSNFDPTGSAATTLGEFLADAAYDDEDSLGSPAEGFVTAWYDQSANANNATQATPDAQPKIYDSSTGLIKENGKPALDWDGTDDVLVTTYSPTVTHTAFFVQVPTTNVVGFLYSSTGTFTNRFWVASTDVNQLQMYRGGSVAYSEGSTLSGQYLGYALNKATTTDIRLGVNGSNVADTGNIGSAVVTNIRVGAEPNSGFYGDSRIQELIIYDSDNSSNRTDIEGNINAHYGIANIGTPSSGLLADYPGSAAAYSVRKLADTAGLAMRIIVDDTAVIGTVDASDTEYDIGFDANGDLDVARIREVCNNPSGANYNAYVVTWYDQSGNGNHATQATYTSCPQIYNGVDVTMENGKPAIYHNDQPLVVSSFTGGASSGTIVGVLANIENTGIPWLSSGSGGPFFLRTNENQFADSAFRALGTVTAHINNVTDTDYQQGDSWNDFNSSQGLMFLDCDTSATTNANFDICHVDAVHWQELIFWDSDQDGAGNRTGIQDNIDSYYRIYGDPDDGLLSTPYGKGAAAAYSVRRLSNNATRAMRILVDADANGPDASDNEYDIGFDVNGELDIARIEELCDKGTGNYDAYVTTWYDQSGEGNDATQTAYASMPKICNAGTVITENGKPVITCGNGQQFEFTDSSGTDNTFTAVIKANHSQNCLISNIGGNVALGLSQSGSTSGDFGFGSVTYFVDGSSFTFTRGNMFTAAQSQILFTAITGDPAQTTLVTGYATATSYRSYNMQELIQWPSDQDSAGNRNFIEANINDYFNIEGV